MSLCPGDAPPGAEAAPGAGVQVPENAWMVPAKPTDRPWQALEKDTPVRSAVVLAWEVQVPFPVLKRMVPPLPTAQQWLASGQETP